MGAAEHQGIDPCLLPPPRLPPRREAGNVVIDPPLLGKRHEERAGRGHRYDARPYGGYRPGVRPALYGPLRADHPYLLYARCLHRGPRPGLYDADHRDVEAPGELPEGVRARGVAGDDYELDPVSGEERRVLHGVPHHRLSGLGAVGPAGRVPEIY